MNKEQFLKDYEEALSKEAKLKAEMLVAKKTLDEKWSVCYLGYRADTTNKRTEKELEALIVTDEEYKTAYNDYSTVYLHTHLASAKVKHLEAVLELEKEV